MTTILFALIVWAVIFYVLWWALRTLALPEPWSKILTVVLVLGTLYVLIGLLTGTIAPFPFLLRM